MTCAYRLLTPTRNVRVAAVSAPFRAEAAHALRAMCAFYIAGQRGPLGCEGKLASSNVPKS